MRVRVAGDEGEVLLELPGSIVLIYAVPIDAPSWVITSQGVEVHADVPFRSRGSGHGERRWSLGGRIRRTGRILPAITRGAIVDVAAQSRVNAA